MITNLIVLILGLLVAAMVVSPLESLHWWARAGAEQADRLQVARAPEPDDTDDRPRRFLVYLSGIGAIAPGDVPEEIPFVQSLQERLPDYRVIDDVFPYAVDNRGLTAGRLFAGLWRALEKIRLRNPNTLLASLINLRNVLQLFVCADRRYGPTYNVGTAGEIYRSLERHGLRPGRGDEVVMLGWSGGAQIALGATWYLTDVGLATRVISLGGLLSDDIALDRVEHLWHLYGSRDFLQASGRVLFAGRWPIAKGSPWNRALKAGRITMREIGPFNHNVREHYFDRTATLPDGRTYADTVVDCIVEILQDDESERRAGVA